MAENATNPAMIICNNMISAVIKYVEMMASGLRSVFQKIVIADSIELLTTKINAMIIAPLRIATAMLLFLSSSVSFIPLIIFRNTLDAV